MPAQLPPSTTWFIDPVVRRVGLRLLAAGDDAEEIQRALNEALALDQPTLRDVIWYLAMFGFGALWQHDKVGAHVLLRGELARERGDAADLGDDFEERIEEFGRPR